MRRQPQRAFGDDHHKGGHRPTAEAIRPALAPGQADAALVEDTVGISAPVLVGSTEPNDTITLYDGNTPIATVKAAGDGSYTITTPTLANGDHSLVAVATDPAGNVGPASDPLDLSVDTVPPGAPLLANVNGATLGDGGLAPSFTVTGVAAAQRRLPCRSMASWWTRIRPAPGPAAPTPSPCPTCPRACTA